MEIDVLKKIIKNNQSNFEKKNKQTRTARRYYANENDILRDDDPINHQTADESETTFRKEVRKFGNRRFKEDYQE